MCLCVLLHKWLNSEALRSSGFIELTDANGSFALRLISNIFALKRRMVALNSVHDGEEHKIKIREFSRPYINYYKSE